MSDAETKVSSGRTRKRSRGPHPSVLSRVCDVPFADRAGVKVLDVPAGQGVIALPLRAAGFDVAACDLIPQMFEETVAELAGQSMEQAYRHFDRGDFSAELRQRLFQGRDVTVPTDVRCPAGDMEERLPFPDGHFDYLISMEGIEHVQDRHKVLREF